MGSKVVNVKYTGTGGTGVFNKLPGPSAELSVEGEQIDDTILGESFNSTYTGLINWTLSSTVYFKGKAGYVAKIKRDGAEMAAQSFELSQSADSIDESDLPSVQANNGYRIQTPGLRTVEITVSGFDHRLAPTVFDIENRTPVTITVNPDGESNNVASGDFYLVTNNLSGDVGPPENKELTYRLNVPYYPSSSGETPFTWTTGGSIPDAIADLIKSFNNRETVDMEYKPQGEKTGDSSSQSPYLITGSCFVTDLTLSAGTDGNIEFSVDLASAGALS